MWLRTENDATTRFKAPCMDEAVEVSSNGTFQVSEAVGEQLLDEYDTIVEHTPETDSA